jgi:hypothetical protein
VAVVWGLRPSEDPRAKNGGDDISVEESATATSDLRFREVQRELRGSKPKSRGTEVDEVASDLEQYRNEVVGDVENNLHVRAKLKKRQREAAIAQGDADGCTRAMRGASASRDPGDPPPVPL